MDYTVNIRDSADECVEFKVSADSEDGAHKEAARRHAERTGEREGQFEVVFVVRGVSGDPLIPKG